MNHENSKQRGFVALMSVLIISAVLAAMLYTLNLWGFFSQFDALSAENKRTSLGLAEACVEAAKLKLVINSTYMPASGGDCVGVGDSCGTSGATQTCRICSISSSGVSRTIVTRAVQNGAYTNLKVSGTIASSTFTVTNWQEIAIYSGANCTLP